MITVRELKRKIGKLEHAILKLGGYVLSCRKKNTDEWMNGLADAVNAACVEVNDKPVWYFNGEGMSAHRPENPTSEGK